MTPRETESNNVSPVTLAEPLLAPPTASFTSLVSETIRNGSQVRVWGVRSGLSLVDQGLTSGAGFAVNILLARWMPAEVYGAFAVTFAAYRCFRIP